jgi:hypothetical protein
MASYPNVRPYLEPSVTTEGFRAFACRLAVAALRIASALSELATLRGTGTMRSTQELLTRALGAPQPSVALVRARATAREIPGRRVA